VCLRITHGNESADAQAVDNSASQKHARVDRASTNSSADDEDHGSELDCSFAGESVCAVC
jgi:hypothetical protein